jgi:hypothetical protein
MFNSGPKPSFATVLVGHSKDRFVVHENLLTHYSEFFRAALTGSFKEAEDKIVKLGNTHGFTFECFVHWLYTQRFPDASKGDDEELVDGWGSSDDPRKLIDSLIDMYIFGDRCMVPQLQRVALDHLYRHIQVHTTPVPEEDDIYNAFGHLRSDNPLCRLLVDVKLYYDHCCDGSSNPYSRDEKAEWPMNGEPDYPSEYLLAFARRATEIYGGIRWGEKNLNDFDLDLCNYHDHKTDEEKETCKQDQAKYEE